MPGNILSLLGTVIWAVIKQWWNRKKPTSEQEALHAKEMEAQNLAQPVGDWHDTVDRLP